MAPFSWIWRLESDFFSFHWRLSKLSSFLKNQASKQNRLSTDLSTSLLNFWILTQDLPNCLFNFFAWGVFWGILEATSFTIFSTGELIPYDRSAAQQCEDQGWTVAPWLESIRQTCQVSEVSARSGREHTPGKHRSELCFQRNWEQNR